jgi:hypothetical protein
MSTEKIIEKKVRVARNPLSILQGAFKLSLQDRVTLCKDLKMSIQKDVQKLVENSNQAQELIKEL